MDVSFGDIILYNFDRPQHKDTKYSMIAVITEINDKGYIRCADIKKVRGSMGVFDDAYDVFTVINKDEIQEKFGNIFDKIVEKYPEFII